MVLLPQHTGMFQWRNKKNKFQLSIVIWRPGNAGIAPSAISCSLNLSIVGIDLNQVLVLAKMDNYSPLSRQKFPIEL